jgi:integrase/recombinase XerD
MSYLLGAIAASPIIAGIQRSRLQEDSLPALYPVQLERGASGELLRARIGVAVVDDYLAYLQAIGRAETTQCSYAYDLAVFCRWLHSQALETAIEESLKQLTAAQIFSFIGFERSANDGRPPRALRTVYRRLVALARFFDWAQVAGLVDHNPVPRERATSHVRGRVKSSPLLRVPTPLPRPAPADELAAFAATLHTWRDRALVALLVGAGLRLSEALGLRLADLDWGGRQVFVRRGKGGRQRWAMAPDHAWAALKAYLDQERPEPASSEEATFLVLHGPSRGQPLTAAGVQSLFRHHRARADAPNVTPHRLRHTCGTDLHRAGMPLEFVQEQLGHRRLDSTRLYVYISNDRLRQAYEAIQPQLYQMPAPEVQ